ncbi:MAG: C25 family cysteine peptidase, partial [Candidatus Thorarchaeota archaeon]
MNIKNFHQKIAIFTLLILLLMASLIPLSASTNDEATWIPFIPGSMPGSTSEVLPKSSDNLGICVDSNFLGMYSLTTIINETRFNVLNIPNAGHTSTIGKPAVPTITRFIEIPDGVQASFEVIYSDMQVLEGYNVVPARESATDNVNATEPPFVIDTALYSTDAFYPLNTVSLEGIDKQDPIIMRGHRLVALTLNPVQFNPITQQLKVYSKIEVRINYDEPAQVGPLDPRLLSPAFEELLEAFVLNYQPRPITMYKIFQPMVVAYSGSISVIDSEESPNGEMTGADYLIITHDDFYHEIRELATWKNIKGLATMIVNTSQIGVDPTADDITDYIKDAYDTWSPAPSYVLLVGDSEFIPPHYKTQHPSSYHGPAANRGLIGTDLYYATVHGTDYYPDIYIGRLSVDTTAQTATIVNKILEYEKNPPDPIAQEDFYTSVTSSAMFQDDDLDGFEDRRFVLTCEEIRDHLLAEGYTVDRIYYADPGSIFPPVPAVNPTNYNNGDYATGAAIPAALLSANGFLWDGDTLDVRNNITDGRFLIYHRDHGLSRNGWNHRPAAENGQWWGTFDGWGDPRYTQADIAVLNNGDLLPVVLSIECQSGWFDGEVDQDHQPAAAPTLNYTRNFESFSEEIVRRQNGGAIAAIGSTRNSFSGYNDQLVRGFIDAIWPDFDPDYASGGLYDLGQVLVFGKIYMAHKHAYDTSITYYGNLVKETFELFHLFGDPELSIWTEPPRVLDVSHPDEIGSQGSQNFVVNVTDQGTGAPIHYAKVCLWKDSEVYIVAYTDPDGGAYFNVYPTSDGDMTKTVPKHKYLPYEETISVTPGGATLTVTPDSGPAASNPSFQGNGFDGTELVDIYFGGTAVDDTVTDASAGAFTKTVEVPAGPIGPINVRAVGRFSGRVAVTVFRRLPDQALPDPYTYSQWDQTTWTLNPAGGDPRWNNPAIILYERASGTQVASNDLRVGTTYTIKADIHNAGTVDATDTEVTFEWG